MTTAQTVRTYSQEDREDMAFLLIMQIEGLLTAEEAQDYIGQIINPCKQACTTA